jgi:hypothetical protein
MWNHNQPLTVLYGLYQCIDFDLQKNNTPHPCAMCAAMFSLSKMVEEKNSQGVVETFCTTGCLLAHKIQSISSSGNCTWASHNGQPSWSLTMVKT